MQVHGICGHRMVYKEVVEALLNHKKSNLWWYGSPTCSDATGSNCIEKDQACVPPRPVWGKRGEGIVWSTVCGAPLDNGLMVIMLMFYSHVVSMVLSLLGVGPVLRSRYEIEWQKVCCITSGKSDVSRVKLQEFNNLILAINCCRVVNLLHNCHLMVSAAG